VPIATTGLEVTVRRIVVLLMLLVTASASALIGPVAASVAFADNGVISSRD